MNDAIFDPTSQSQSEIKSSIKEKKKPIDILRHGIEKELPSGLVVRIRPIDTGVLLTSNMIPENLMAIVRKQIIGIEKGQDEIEVAQKISDDVKAEVGNDAQKTLDFYNSARAYGEAVARVCIVYPKVVDDPKNDDEMAASWLSTDDCFAFGALPGVPLKEMENFSFIAASTLALVQSDEAGADSKSGDQSEAVVTQSPVADELPAAPLVSDVSV